MLRALLVSFAVWLVASLAGLACSRQDPRPLAEPAPSLPQPPPRQQDPEQARFDEERRPDLIVATLGIKPGAQVADIGAGSGLLTVHLARAVAPGGKVVAADIENAVLDLLRNRLDRAKLSGVVEPRVVEADTPGLEPASYDVILLSEVDHYFSDPEAWLGVAKAALKPDGAIAITNRIHHRARGLAAAKAAGLHLVSENSPVPSTFLAVFRLQPLSSATAPRP